MTTNNTKETKATSKKAEKRVIDNATLRKTIEAQGKFIVAEKETHGNLALCYEKHRVAEISWRAGKAKFMIAFKGFLIDNMTCEIKGGGDYAVTYATEADLLATLTTLHQNAATYYAAKAKKTEKPAPKKAETAKKPAPKKPAPKKPAAEKKATITKASK